MLLSSASSSLVRDTGFIMSESQGSRDSPPETHRHFRALGENDGIGRGWDRQRQIAIHAHFEGFDRIDAPWGPFHMVFDAAAVLRARVAPVMIGDEGLKRIGVGHGGWRGRARRDPVLFARGFPGVSGGTAGLDTGALRMTFPCRVTLRLRSGRAVEITGEEPGACGRPLGEQFDVVSRKCEAVGLPARAR